MAFIGKHNNSVEALNQKGSDDVWTGLGENEKNQAAKKKSQSLAWI